MSVYYHEGFDDGIMQGVPNGADLPTISTATVRTGTRSLKCVTSGSARASYYTVSHAPIATGITSLAMNLELINNNSPLWGAYDNATQHLTLRLRTDGKFEVTRAGTALATGTFVYTPGQWVHLSFKWTISDTVGVFELRINGNTTPDINLSAADTRNAANAVVSQQIFGHLDSNFNNTGNDLFFDDIVLQDTTGAAPENSWLGETQVDYVFPNGAGDNADFTLGGSSPAGTTHESLDDVPSDEGVTLIKSATVGHKATCAFGDLTGGGVVYCVSGIMRAKKAVAGSRGVKQSVKLAGTEVLGSEHFLSTSWHSYVNIWHRDPASAVWTVSNVNATKAGAEVTT